MDKKRESEFSVAKERERVLITFMLSSPSRLLPLLPFPRHFPNKPLYNFVLFTVLDDNGFALKIVKSK
jgi:hypothetical protein